MTHFEMVQILKCKPAALREQSSVTFASPTSRTGCSPFYSRFCSSNYPSKAVILYVQEYLISFLFVLTPLIVSGVIKNRKCRKHNPDNRYCQSLSVFFSFPQRRAWSCHLLECVYQTLDSYGSVVGTRAGDWDA